MELRRKGEVGSLPYRTGRFYCVDSHWYFSTREGVEQGPFNTRDKAQLACSNYINICLQIENRVGHAGNFSLTASRGQS